MLDERSNDSKIIFQVMVVYNCNPLWDKFNTCSAMRSPIILGICPSNLLLERSIVVYKDKSRLFSLLPKLKVVWRFPERLMCCKSKTSSWSLVLPQHSGIAPFKLLTRGSPSEIIIWNEEQFYRWWWYW